jgi:hypothetical protein
VRKYPTIALNAPAAFTLTFIVLTIVVLTMLASWRFQESYVPHGNDDADKEALGRMPALRRGDGISAEAVGTTAVFIAGPRTDAGLPPEVNRSDQGHCFIVIAVVILWAAGGAVLARNEPNVSSRQPPVPHPQSTRARLTRSPLVRVPCNLDKGEGGRLFTRLARLKPANRQRFGVR